MINIFSFFSGAGFLDLGFELQGNYDILFVNEYHKSFNRIYQYAREKMNLHSPRFGHHVEDITEYLDGNHEVKLHQLIGWVNQSKRERITGFIGGPPCPDFSVAGRNKGRDGENGKLSGTYARLICIAQPDFFLFENVKGLYRTARHREFFEELKQQFRNAGYSLTEQLVNSLEFGAPQDRDRIILIGIQRHIADQLGLPINKGALEHFPWKKYKLYDLQNIKRLPWPSKAPYHEGVGTPMPEGIVQELTVEHWWKKNDVLHHPNENMFFKPRAGIVRFTTKDEGDVEKKCYKRLHRWRYSPTAAYGNNEVHIHPYLPRRISVAESLAIQTLPKEFVLPLDVTLSDAFKTIGNGVPFVLANGIAKSIYDYINHIK